MSLLAHPLFLFLCHLTNAEKLSYIRVPQLWDYQANSFIIFMWHVFNYNYNSKETHFQPYLIILRIK